MIYTVQQIADALGVPAFGASDILIETLAEPAMAGPRDLALASNPKYADQLTNGQARAALLWADANWEALGLEAAICVERPRHALSSVSAMYDAEWRQGAGIHPSAVVDPSAHIAEDVAIGALCVIAENVKIGRGSRIGAHVSIGRGSEIGEYALIRDGVRIAHNVTAGARLVVQPGAIIGGDGFSFVTPEVSAAETVRSTLGEDTQTTQQEWARIHSLGGVEIGDNVEIGAGTSVDRGTIRATRIGAGSKIDSLVQVGHNVQIGRDCLLCAQVGVGGSTVVGDSVILGGKSGLADNITVGDRVVTGGATIVMANVPAGRAMLGYPATQMQSQIESYKALRRLPRLARDVTALKKAVPNTDGSD